MATYLLINLASIFIPFIFTFHPRLRFYKTWKAFWPACIIVALLFIIWDIFFTKWGVWGFNSQYLSGIQLFYLPLGEWLFFICIPYACIFTYHCLKILIKKDFFKPFSQYISTFAGIILLVLSFVYWEKYYTNTTFLLTGILLLYLKNAWFMGRFYFAYIILLIPFFIVNGILTGSGIENEVVWYNNNENLSIRLITVPVEDLFYAMLLILLNVSLYEYFLKKSGYYG